MTPEQMEADAREAESLGLRMTLARKRGIKMPPGFPRGELLCEGFDGRNSYSYDPSKVLAWLTRSGLINSPVPHNVGNVRRSRSECPYG